MSGADIKKFIDHPAGDKADEFKKIKGPDDAPSRHRDDPRFDELIVRPPPVVQLSSDPAHGGKQGATSTREAMAGLEAETAGKLDAPITRGPKEIEFFDGSGRPST